MTQSVTAFFKDEIVAAGAPYEVARAIVERGLDREAGLVVVEDESGKAIDLDYREAPPPPRPAGRPRLGVTAREVTLLPRHWDWLAAQRGGASATLRRLVEEAARSGVSGKRARQDAAYRFMQAICGDKPGYEEALRALYRDDRSALEAATASWPRDVRSYLSRFAGA
jgi:hypothetical protein